MIFSFEKASLFQETVNDNLGLLNMYIKRKLRILKNILSMLMKILTHPGHAIFKCLLDEAVRREVQLPPYSLIQQASSVLND